MRSLVVDDDQTTRIVLEDTLAEYGECHTSSTGKEAVIAFEKALESGEPYDVVIMDIMMPEMDGQEALEHIRKIEHDNGIFAPGDVKVVMLTALNDASNQFKAFYRGGAAAYLTKPVELSDLIKTIKSLNLI